VDWVATGEIVLGLYSIIASRIGTRTLIARQRRDGWVKLKNVGPRGENWLRITHIVVGMCLVLDGAWLRLLSRFLGLRTG
jgi:hypothetical protein